MVLAVLQGACYKVREPCGRPKKRATGAAGNLAAVSRWGATG